MIQTRQYIKYVMILMLGVLCIPEIIFAQKFTAKANTTSVPLNGVVQVTYELQNGTEQSFQAPSFKGFQVVNNSTFEIGNDVTINGRTQAIHVKKFVYNLSPTQIGKFTINPANIKVNGKVISSNSLTITVTNSSNKRIQIANNRPITSSMSNIRNNSSNDAKDFFIKTFIDNPRVFIGQQVTLTTKLFSRIKIINYNILKEPTFDGFWCFNLSVNKNSVENINGINYNVFEISKKAIFPQKLGTFTMEPTQVEVAYMDDQNVNIFNLFDDNYKTIKSNVLVVNVVSLPTVNQPSDFSGFVGDLKMETKFDKFETKVNEPISLTFKFSGEGNMNLLDKPSINFIDSFEVFEPQIHEENFLINEKVAGVKTFNYLIIPRSQGNFTIAPFSISYFDLATRTYKTLKSEAFSVKVNKGDGNTVAVAGKSDVKYLNQDIKHIDTGLFTLHKKGNLFFHSLFFWIICFLPFLGLAIFIILMRRRIKLKADTVLLKNKQATRMALKRLKLAKQLLQKKELDGFYIELSKGLWGYLADKFAIPGSRLSLATAEETLMSKNLSEESRKKFIDILNQCEYSRFSPNGKLETQAELLYNEAINIIVQTEQELKK